MSLLTKTRSLAASVGRGMLTMGTLQPLIAEALPLPPLSLSGRIPPNNSIVTLDAAAAPAELTLWPEFHNGVAAGLRIGILPSTSSHQRIQSQKSFVTRNWIVYNKTAAAANGQESTHAGSLTSFLTDYWLETWNPSDMLFDFRSSAGIRFRRPS